MDNDDYFKPFDGYDDDDDDRQGSVTRGRRFARRNEPEPEEDEEEFSPASPPPAYGDSPFRRTNFDDDEFAERHTYGTTDPDDEFDSGSYVDDFESVRPTYDDDEDEEYVDDEYVDYSHGVNTYDTGAQKSMRQWILVGLGLFVALILIGFGLSKVFGGNDSAQQGPTDTTMLPTSVPSVTTIPNTAPPTTKKPSSGSAKSQIEAQINGALLAWEKYAETGQLGVLDPYFIESGPQYASLKADIDRANGAKYDIKPTYLEVLDGDNARRLVILDVTIKPENGSAEDFKWQVEVRKSNDAWKVYEIKNR